MQCGIGGVLHEIRRLVVDLVLILLDEASGGVRDQASVVADGELELGLRREEKG